MADMRERFPETHERMMRLNEEQFDFIFNILEPFICKKDTNWRKAIPAEMRLSMTLVYLSSGDSFSTLSVLFRVGISTLREIVLDVCTAIFTHLQPLYLSTPNDEDSWKAIADGFMTRWNFPRCLGKLRMINTCQPTLI